MLLVARPGAAFAQLDIIDWLSEFSGPGPFSGHIGQSVSVRALCIKDDEQGNHHADTCFFDDMDERIKLLVGVTFSFTSSDHARFSNTTATDSLNGLPINASRLEVTYSYRVSPMLDVGIGAGALVFTGDGFSNQVHPIITPVQMTFVPLGILRKGAGLKWGRVVKLQFADRYVLGDINAKADFGSTSNYLTHGEFNPAFTVFLDILPLFARTH
jgi:hypothetical protein